MPVLVLVDVEVNVLVLVQVVEEDNVVCGQPGGVCTVLDLQNSGVTVTVRVTGGGVVQAEVVTAVVAGP